MVKKLTNEDIVERMYSLVGDEYSKLDNVYINSSTKFKIKHNTCGYEYYAEWNHFQRGRRCPKCSGFMKLTNENIVERIYELVGDEYTKVDDIYINAKTKFSIKHELCGHEYKIAWNTFQQGARCPKCSCPIKLTNEDVIKRMYELVGNEYSKLNNIYVNNSTKFPIRHELCGHEYEVNWGSFKDGRRCPKCGGSLKLTNEDIIARIYELVGDEYSKLDDVYVNTKTKFLIRHNLCGYDYEVNWGNFSQSKLCPKCNQSKGEKFISDYLINKNISFTTQVRFDACRYKKPLPFDFSIIDNNNNIVVLIEFDGQQHFESKDYFGGEENLALTQLRDQIKNQYCKDNNIPLLRIRYDEDIEEKLTAFLKEQNIIEGE